MQFLYALGPFWAENISTGSGRKWHKTGGKIMRCDHLQGREKTEYKQNISGNKQLDGHLSKRNSTK